MWWVKTVHGDYVNLEMAHRIYAHQSDGDLFLAAAEFGESRCYLGRGMSKDKAHALIDVIEAVEKQVPLVDLSKSQIGNPSAAHRTTSPIPATESDRKKYRRIFRQIAGTPAPRARCFAAQSDANP